MTASLQTVRPIGASGCDRRSTSAMTGLLRFACAFALVGRAASHGAMTSPLSRNYFDKARLNSDGSIRAGRPDFQSGNGLSQNPPYAGLNLPGGSPCGDAGPWTYGQGGTQRHYAGKARHPPNPYSGTEHMPAAFLLFTPPQTPHSSPPLALLARMPATRWVDRSRRTSRCCGPTRVGGERSHRAEPST